MILDDKIKDQKILVVDDEETNVRLLARILQRAGFVNYQTLTDSRQVVAEFVQFRPDLVVLDLHMPEMDGFQVMEALAPLRSEDLLLPILILTADVSPEAKRRALGVGATDFLPKPFDTVEVMLRIRNLLEVRYLHSRLKQNNQVLEVRVQERTRELEMSRYEVLERLALAAEFRDDTTGEHTRRVGRMAGVIATELGLSPSEVSLLQEASPLHDIGKIGISDQILLKRAPLTDAEREIMKSHTQIGARILSGSEFPLMQLAEQIAASHHEWWDGNGYPHNLAGDAIPLGARITALADVFDALTHERPYKTEWGWTKATSEVLSLAGTQFDPAVVAAFAAADKSGTLREAMEEERAPAGAGDGGKVWWKAG